MKARLFNKVKGITNSKEALRSIDMEDVLIEIDDDTRIRLQNSILFMYKDLKCVCEKYSITPYLVGGSAIGSLRHKGFIPWDDDLDIAMSRSDYNKFVEIFSSELGDSYVLNAPNMLGNSKNRFPKVYKKDTVFREIFEKDDSEPNGLFLDIFIIENIPRNRLVRFFKGTRCNFLQFISSQVYIYENDNPVSREVLSRAGTYRMKRIIGKLFSWRKASRWFDIIDKASQYKHTGLCGIVTGRHHYFGEIFEEDVFFPAKYVPFCDIEAPVFNDLDKYLTYLHGNYMELPPVDKRERHFVKELKF